MKLISRPYLHHGSNQQVDEPTWNKGSRYRDFGQCFYTTYDEHMARDWASKMEGPTIVNRYVFDWEKLEAQTGNLKVKRFKADAEWAEFIYKNRYVKGYRRPFYDIIVGPLADRHLVEQFSRIKSEGLTFADIAAKIEYTRFTSLQICFCSDRAVKMLERF